MPSTASASVAGVVCHVINRGNGRAPVFHNDGDRSRWMQWPLIAHVRPRCRDWPWSSLSGRSEAAAKFLHPGPVPRGDRWVQAVNRPLGEAELEAIRRIVNRRAPFGGPIWTRRTAERLGLESSLRPRGRRRTR